MKDLETQINIMQKFKEILVKYRKNLEIAQVTYEEGDKQLEDAKLKYLEGIYHNAPYLTFKAIKTAVLYDVLNKTFREIAEKIKLGDKANAYYHYAVYLSYLKNKERELPSVFLRRTKSEKTFTEFLDRLEKELQEILVKKNEEK